MNTSLLIFIGLTAFCGLAALGMTRALTARLNRRIKHLEDMHKRLANLETSLRER